jgi:hypothetical protein
VTIAPERRRLKVALHEAAHAVAFVLAGWPLERVKLSVDGASGEVVPGARTIASITEAQDYILAVLAGQAFERSAWLSGLLGNEEVPDELTVEEILQAPPGATKAQAVAFYRTGTIDEDIAERIARGWTSSGLEAEALLNYLRLRAAAWVVTEGFVSMVNQVAGVLLERGEVAGKLVTELVSRTSTVLACGNGAYPRAGGRRDRAGEVEIRRRVL